jgi:hypothetical protein
VRVRVRVKVRVRVSPNQRRPGCSSGSTSYAT